MAKRVKYVVLTVDGNKEELFGPYRNDVEDTEKFLDEEMSRIAGFPEFIMIFDWGVRAPATKPYRVLTFYTRNISAIQVKVVN